MSKKVLILSTSLRKGSNSEALAKEFEKGAKEAGHDVEIVYMHDKTIYFCTGCLICQETKRCIIHDDADIIAQKMLTSEVIVFATPIYFYEMSGQMKTMLDRSNPLFPSDYAFRDIYLLATAAEEEAQAMDGAINGLMGWIDCFEKTNLKAVVRGNGVTDIGDIEGNSALRESYELGRSL